jgi:casein kinase II subunit alpha
MYLIFLFPQLESILYNFKFYFSHPKKPLQKFVNFNNSHLCSADCLDLLSKMLILDHSERITVKEALDHPYFNPIKEKMADKLKI